MTTVCEITNDRFPYERLKKFLEGRVVDFSVRLDQQDIFPSHFNNLVNTKFAQCTIDFSLFALALNRTM